MVPMRAGRLLLAVLALAFVASGCQEDGTIVVHSLSFSGVKSVDESRLRNSLATHASSRIPWGKKSKFNQTQFEADLKRVTAFYADRGFPDARVTTFDAKVNAPKNQVDLSVTIDEGQPVKVASIDFAGFDVIPPARLAALKKSAPLSIGQPRDRQLVASTYEAAVNELKDHGYPYAKVSTAEDDGRDGKQAAITFTAEPGVLAHFGSVQVSGNKSVDEHIISRELTFKPGDLFQRSVLQDSQRRLYGLELFQFANVEPVNSDQQPDAVPVRVTVAEGKHQRLNFGVGYGTEEKARVDAEYHHLNFLGGARTAGLHVRWSSLDRGVRADFTQPYFFAPHFSFGAEAQDWYTVTPAYSSSVSGAKISVTHRADPRTSWSVSFGSEYDHSTISDTALNDPSLRSALIALGLDPSTNAQSGTLSVVGFDLQHSTADSPLNAHHGYQIAFHAEDASSILRGTFGYLAGSIDARQYLPLTDALVIASRGQLGNIRPDDGDEAKIPFAKRYFLGGASSLRGWGLYEVSPLSESGLPIGGDSLFAFSEELRAQLHGKVGGVFFLDGGNVWAKSGTIALDDLRYAIGAGLRYQTPVGPLRLDYGYQLNPIPDLQVNGVPQTRRWRVHFSIGQAF
jgi:outer membrane protein assembly complex protein YaeT